MCLRAPSTKGRSPIPFVGDERRGRGWLEGEKVERGEWWERKERVRCTGREMTRWRREIRRGKRRDKEGKSKVRDKERLGRNDRGEKRGKNRGKGKR